MNLLDDKPSRSAESKSGQPFDPLNPQQLDQLGEILDELLVQAEAAMRPTLKLPASDILI